ncbi:MAG: ribosome biogenesis GTPase Der [Atribacterota bacterium]
MVTKIAIIGKTNTGKSTLFNRLVGYRKAIVLRETGITRDRNYADFSWKGKSFTLIDTGGIDYDKEKESIQGKIVEQSKRAIIESDIVLLMLDIMTGIQQEDIDIAKFIRRKNMKTILVINKNDIKNKNYFLGDFIKLGMGNPFFVSAEQGENIGELLERILQLAAVDNKTDKDKKEKNSNIIKIAIIGKPNVGKSSILNALLNDERIIVDNHPGTTRDNIEASMYFNEFKLIFVDTSGLRRKKSVKEKVEYLGNIRALESIKKVDIVLLVLNANNYVSMQDKRLAEKIMEEKKACIVLLNKYDLVAKQKEIDKNLLLKISRYELRFLKDTQILTTIAVGAKKNVSQILKAIIDTYNEYNKNITTPELNKFLQKIVNYKPPKIINGRRLHFFYITQVGVTPPTFKIFVNEPELLYNSYQRYLENQFVQYFNLKGIPIVLHYQKRKKY